MHLGKCGFFGRRIVSSARRWVRPARIRAARVVLCVGFVFGNVGKCLAWSEGITGPAWASAPYLNVLNWPNLGHNTGSPFGSGAVDAYKVEQWQNLLNDAEQYVGGWFFQCLYHGGHIVSAWEDNSAAVIMMNTYQGYLEPPLDYYAFESWNEDFTTTESGGSPVRIFISASSDDFDGDGYSDTLETAASTDPDDPDSHPTSTDSDNDGLLDAWEYEKFNDLDEVASGDPDADGWSNLQEYAGNTDPASSSSHPSGGAMLPSDFFSGVPSQFGTTNGALWQQQNNIQVQYEAEVMPDVLAAGVATGMVWAGYDYNTNVADMFAATLNDYTNEENTIRAGFADTSNKVMQMYGQLMGIASNSTTKIQEQMVSLAAVISGVATPEPNSYLVFYPGEPGSTNAMAGLMRAPVPAAGTGPMIIAPYIRLIAQAFIFLTAGIRIKQLIIEAITGERNQNIQPVQWWESGWTGERD